MLLQPELANTFELIADEGSDVFYTGEIAEAIIETQMATRTDGGLDILAGVGRMTLDDLANYDVVIRKPVADTYRGYTIAGMGPPSSGAFTVLQMLKMVERFPSVTKEADSVSAPPEL